MHWPTRCQPRYFHSVENMLFFFSGNIYGVGSWLITTLVLVAHFIYREGGSDRRLTGDFFV